MFFQFAGGPGEGASPTWSGGVRSHRWHGEGLKGLEGKEVHDWVETFREPRDQDLWVDTG